MKVKQFLSALEHDRVHRAIQAAEHGTSGDIVVYISHRPTHDPLASAHRAFRKLHRKTDPDRNNLLIFLAPQSQKFAVVGGTALHDQMGQVWWDELIALLTLHFKQGHYTEGLVTTIERAGKALKTHFPAGAVDRTGERDIVEE